MLLILFLHDPAAPADSNADPLGVANQKSPIQDGPMTLRDITGHRAWVVDQMPRDMQVTPVWKGNRVGTMEKSGDA